MLGRVTASGSALAGPGRGQGNSLLSATAAVCAHHTGLTCLPIVRLAYRQMFAHHIEVQVPGATRQLHCNSTSNQYKSLWHHNIDKLSRYS
jgi:hypothetical protein